MKKIHLVPVLLSALALGVGACSGSPDDGASQDSEFNDGLSPELINAARANLMRVSGEIDRNHMANYKLDGALADQFIKAVRTEYAAKPLLLKSRMQTLASMVFFSAPQVTTKPGVGTITPFHGMDEAAFEALMSNEDTVFSHHVSVNGGSPNGVRPFSVCETTFFIKMAKGEITDPAFVANRTISNYDAYARAYAAYAKASCAEADLADWYNFRGLGGLRPSWLESNLSDRFLRRMVSQCKKGAATPECNQWNADRLGYRDAKNTELALREMVYDPNPELMVEGSSQSLASYLLGPSNAGVLVEDRNGDGVGEWLATGPLKAAKGAMVDIASNSTFTLTADATATLSSKLSVSVNGANRDLASGEKITLKSGMRAGLSARLPYDPASKAPIAISGKVKITGGTMVLADGATATFSYSGAWGDAPQAKLDVALSFPVAADWAPRFEINHPSSGVLAQNKFAGELQVPIRLANGSTFAATIAAEDLVAYDQVDPKWKKDYLAKKDFGLLSIFSDGAGCSVDKPTPEACPLLQRFYSVIDRHENFYQTYSSMQAASESVSQQPSPLVACSITLRASHQWDTAGTPTGGTAGFIYLMRIPFAEILSSDTRSIDTLGLLQDKNGDGKPDNDLTAGPKVATLGNVYKGVTPLEMDKVWLDIATLSHNQYSSEHEISKFGSVPAEQIAGMLVIRLPVAMANGVDPGLAAAPDPTDEDPTDHGGDAAAPPPDAAPADAGKGG